MEVFGVFFFFQAEDGIRDVAVTGVQTCALPISGSAATAKPCFTPSDRTSLSRGATATIGFPAARIPYILLGTTTPSSPRFTVTMSASAAAKTEIGRAHV